MSLVGTATAHACANIALIKYWGKRQTALNLPAAGSLSLTLDGLRTETTVRFDASLPHDRFVLDGQAQEPGETAKLGAWLDLVRARARVQARAEVTSVNHFPTASGLASSASGYAALALAATTAAGLSLTPRELSMLARQGSGSAARSIFGGFVRLHAGDRDDGQDCYAAPLTSPLAARIRMVIAVVAGGKPKLNASRDAMTHTALTSPLYQAWLACVPPDLRAAEAALANDDLAALGAVAEGNAMAMHASAIAARPSILYWQTPSVALLAEVARLRAAGLPAWATMDAGPHVKVITDAEHATDLAAALTVIPGVTRTIIASSGPAATLVHT